MKIWLVNLADPLPGELFRPGRYTTLVNLLIKNGHQVVWWSSNFFHHTKSYRKEIKEIPGLKTILLPTPQYNKNAGLRRIINHYVFANGFGKRFREIKDRPDVILASCPPLISAKTAIKVAKKIKTKCIIDVRDLWPEAFKMFLPPIFGNILSLPLRKYANSIYDSSDALMAVSQTYKDRAISVSRNKIKKTLVYPIGIDLNLFDNESKERSSFEIEKKPNEFWVTYIGTISKSYDIETLLKCAKSFINSYPSIKFFVAGGGPDLDKMKNLAGKYGLKNCIFTGWLFFKDMISLLKKSDIGLNTIVAKSETTFPNKVFEFMAAGLPVINSVRGEFEDLLKSEKIGRQYLAENVDSLAEAILYLYNRLEEIKTMGKNARKLVEREFDRNKIYPKFENFLKEVVEQK